MDDTTIVDVFSKLGELKGAIGWIALSVFATIRLYRLPEWQGSLPPAIRWENLPDVTKYVIIALLTGLGAALTAEANGLGWKDATATGILAGLTAIAGNKLAKPTHALVVQGNPQDVLLARAPSDVTFVPKPPVAP